MVQNQSMATPQMDPLLVPLLGSQNESESDSILTQLLTEHAEPLIKQIVSYKLRVYISRSTPTSLGRDCEDICNEVVVQLLTRIADLRSNPEDKGIHNLRSYIAVATYRACYEYLRRKYPQRYSLKNKIRYCLTHQKELGLWETEQEEWTGGLAKWITDKSKPTDNQESTVRLRQLQSSPQTFASTLPNGTAMGMNLADLLLAIFKWVQQPVEIDTLVGVLAELLGTKDQQAEQGTDTDDRPVLAGIADQRTNLAKEIDQRIYLQKLWEEITQMSRRHCAALLLNLRDEQGSGALDLFLFTGLVSLKQIANALGLSEEELAGFWNDLPLDDNAIAEKLQISRQQVINLRKSARERLSRRMVQLGF